MTAKLFLEKEPFSVITSGAVSFMPYGCLLINSVKTKAGFPVNSLTVPKRLHFTPKVIRLPGTDKILL